MPQLAVDADDCSALARTGLHAEAELERTTRITGRAVTEITANAKPGRPSGAGFVADNEVQEYWSIRIWRAPTYGERRYPQGRNGHLSADQLAALTKIRYRTVWVKSSDPVKVFP